MGGEGEGEGGEGIVGEIAFGEARGEAEALGEADEAFGGVASEAGDADAAIEEEFDLEIIGEDRAVFANGEPSNGEAIGELAIFD